MTEGKKEVKYKIIQDAEERELYFVACHLVWMKEWLLLRYKRLLDLEDHDLRLGGTVG